jgi:hypothetical protein
MAVAAGNAAFPPAGSRSNSPFMGPQPSAAPPADALCLPGAAVAAAPSALTAAAPLPLFKPMLAHLSLAAAAASRRQPRLSVSGSASHSHASSMAAADQHCAAALLADEASTPRPSPLQPQQQQQEQQQQQQQQQQQEEEAAAAMVVCEQPHLGHLPAADAETAAAVEPEAGGAVDADEDGLGWQHALVACSWLFKPCPGCCRGHTGREVRLQGGGHAASCTT